MEKIKDLSIRARVAFSILCLEAFIKFLNYDISKWNLILSELWKYTNTNVGKWHENISEMTPFSINEKIAFELKGCENIDESKHDELQKLYADVNIEILKIINLIFEIGTRDLYSSITNHSQDTISYLKEIILVLEKNGIDLPNINGLQKFSILENNGWGSEFKKEDILNENI